MTTERLDLARGQEPSPSVSTQQAYERTATAPPTIDDEWIEEIEHPVVVAHQAEPALSLSGTIVSIKRGRRDFALSDDEWVTRVGLPHDAKAFVSEGAVGA